MRGCARAAGRRLAWSVRPHSASSPTACLAFVQRRQLASFQVALPAVLSVLPPVHSVPGIVVAIRLFCRARRAGVLPTRHSAPPAHGPELPAAALPWWAASLRRAASSPLPSRRSRNTFAVTPSVGVCQAHPSRQLHATTSGAIVAVVPFVHPSSVCGRVWPNLSLNADVPYAGLRPRSAPPVSLFR